MLKTLNCTNFDIKNTLTKCGIIFYSNHLNDYSIECSCCKLKCFDYSDFLLHFRNLHLSNVNATENAQNQIKTEEFAVNDRDSNLWESTEEHVYSDEELLPLEDVAKNELEDEAENQTNELDIHEKLEIEHLITTDTEDDKIVTATEGDVIDDEEDFENAEHADDDDYVPEIESKPKVKKKKEKTKPPETHVCEICQRTFYSLVSLKSHIKRDHEKPEKVDINCNECSEKFATWTQMEHHSFSQHGGILCLSCGKRFRNKQGYSRHIPIHLETKSFACTFENCNKKFFSKSSLSNHVRLHKKGNTFVCEICGYACQNAAVLKVHIRAHTKGIFLTYNCICFYFCIFQIFTEKPFQCNICQKCFASSSLLSEHKQSHNNLRPYVCDVCGKAFNRQKALYHHKPLHLPEKKFKCRLCGQAFAQAAGLAGHMRKHREAGDIQ